MILTKFGAVYIPKSQSTDYQVVGRSSLEPLARGAIDLDGQEFFAQSHDITHELTFFGSEGQTSEEQVSAFLAQAARGRSILSARTRDGLDIQTWAKVLSAEYVSPPGSTGGYQSMSVTFELDHPYWYATDDEPLYLDTGWFLDNGYLLDAGNVSTTTITSAITNWTLIYTGSVRNYKGHIVVVPRSGASLTSITIRNSTTDEQISWSDSLAYSDELLFEMLTQSVLVNNVGDYINFTSPATQVGWLTLAPGNNTIKITSSGVSGIIDVYWYWSRSYLR